jgi:hypothetical protein
MTHPRINAESAYLLAVAAFCLGVLLGHALATAPKPATTYTQEGSR